MVATARLSALTRPLGGASCSRPMEGRWIESVGSRRAKTVAGLLWTGSLRTLHSPRRVGLTMQMQCGAADVQQLSRSQEEGITAVPVGKSSVHRAAEGGRFSRSSAMRRPLGYAMSASRPSPTRGACSPCLPNAARSHWILRARRLPAACSHHRRRGTPISTWVNEPRRQPKIYAGKGGKRRKVALLLVVLSNRAHVQ